MQGVPSVAVGYDMTRATKAPGSVTNQARHLRSSGTSARGRFTKADRALAGAFSREAQGSSRRRGGRST